MTRSGTIYTMRSTTDGISPPTHTHTQRRTKTVVGMNRALRRSYQLQESGIFERRCQRQSAVRTIAPEEGRTANCPMMTTASPSRMGDEAVKYCKSLEDAYFGGKSFEPLALRHFGSRGCKSLEQKIQRCAYHNMSGGYIFVSG